MQDPLNRTKENKNLQFVVAAFVVYQIILLTICNADAKFF